MLTSAQENAEKIIEKHDKVLASKRDKEIFFKELLSPSKPNKALINASNRYKKTVHKK